MPVKKVTLYQIHLSLSEALGADANEYARHPQPHACQQHAVGVPCWVHLQNRILGTYKVHCHFCNHEVIIDFRPK